MEYNLWLLVFVILKTIASFVAQSREDFAVVRSRRHSQLRSMHKQVFVLF